MRVPSEKGAEQTIMIENKTQNYENKPKIMKIIQGVFSSEGALYVIMPYDYPAQRSATF